jgi:hypothetical protein
MMNMQEQRFNDISYEQFLHQDRLMGSKCEDCGALYVPPRPLCIQCQGSRMQWLEVSGRGKLKAFTCIAVVPPSMTGEGYDRKNPYCTGVVELEEGSRVVARIEGVDTHHPETIKIGTPLTVLILHRGEENRLRTFLAFKPL